MSVQVTEDFVSHEKWQLAEIEAGLAEADRGEFASDEELAHVIAKYSKRGRPAVALNDQDS